MFSFLKKSPEEISRTNPGYEEAERKTPKLGVVLLLLMVIAGTFFGWRALDDLSSIPTRPPSLSSCGYQYHSAYVAQNTQRQYTPPSLYQDYQPYDYYQDYSKCEFSAIEQAHNIPALFLQKKPFEDTRNELSKQLSSIENQLQAIRYQRDQLSNKYNLGLQEQQAGVPQNVYSVAPDVQAELTSLLNQESELAKQSADLHVDIQKIVDDMKPIDAQITEAYKSALPEQNSLQRWFEFKVFLLQFLFVFPFFFLVFRGYLKLHRKSSPYTIIMTAMVAVAGILLLRILLQWFWGLFLAQILDVIIEWFGHYGFMRTIIFYSGMLLSFGVFGGAVYFLQKKIFDPRRVIIRRFRAKECPHCQTSLDLSQSFCPNCGHQIKEKCPQCGQARFIGLPNCPSCGVKSGA